jgi:hypothetical protein
MGDMTTFLSCLLGRSAGSASSMVIGRPLAAPIHRASREDLISQLAEKCGGEDAAEGEVGKQTIVFSSGVHFIIN